MNITKELINECNDLKRYTAESNNYVSDIFFDHFFLHFENKSDDMYIINAFLEKYNSFNINNIKSISLEEKELLNCIIDNSSSEILNSHIKYILLKFKSICDVDSFILSIRSAIKSCIDVFALQNGYLCVQTATYLFNYFIQIAEQYKKKKEFQDFYKLIIDLLESLPITNFLRLSFTLNMVDMLKDKKLIVNSMLIDVLKKLINGIPDQKYHNEFKLQIIDNYENLLDLAIIIDKENKKEYQEIRANYLYNQRENYSFTYKQHKLQKAIKDIRAVSLSDTKKINKFQIALDEANKEVIKNMHIIKVPISENEQIIFNKQRKKYDELFEKKTNVQKLYFLLDNIPLLSKDEFKKLIDKQNKASFFKQLMPTVVLDREGKIIDISHLPEEEQTFMNECPHIYQIWESYYLCNCIDAFLCCFTYDEDVSIFINEMLSNNLICKPNRIGLVKNAIECILNRNYEQGLSNLIIQLESGLRYFLKEKGISNATVKGRKIVYIDLNDILKDDTENIYRKTIGEYLEEEYLFSLEYLCIMNPGGNIRNECMHGNMEPDAYRSYQIVYLTMLIIKMYLGFYFCAVEEN